MYRKLVRQLRLKVLVTYRRGSEYKSLSFQFHGNVSRLIRIQKQNGGLLFCGIEKCLYRRGSVIEIILVISESKILALRFS